MECRIKSWPDSEDHSINPTPDHTWIEFSLGGELLEVIYNEIPIENWDYYTRNPLDTAGQQAINLYSAIAVQSINRAKARNVPQPAEVDGTVFGVTFLVSDDTAGFWGQMLELAASTEETRGLVAQLFETLTSLETALETES
jgi:hypothetical protein